ncbi:MAG: dephospho-CoA kinase [Chromatiales bacterium]|jgi:dephospho-CoA kinase|nr:dephospho-CoA kinase [Chromatiales bacterium]
MNDHPLLRPPLRIGLTGGIGSGKSTVSAYFQELGIPVIDADDIARALVAPGAPGFAPVLTAFGPDILDAQGQLDRTRLRRIIFADPAQRRELEAILHPLVRAQIRECVQELSAPYCIIAIPLLIETGQSDQVDRVLVIDAPEDVQLARVMTRPGWSAQDAKRVIRSQASRAERLRAADDIIANTSDLPALQLAVAQLHQRYLTLTKQQLSAH